MYCSISIRLIGVQVYSFILTKVNAVITKDTYSNKVIIKVMIFEIKIPEVYNSLLSHYLLRLMIFTTEVIDFLLLLEI